MGTEVEVLLIGDEEGLQEAAEDLGVRQLDNVDRNDEGTPLVNSIFNLARQTARHDTLCYVNADILFLDDLLPTLRMVEHRFDRYLIVGQRWDLDVVEPINFNSSWIMTLRDQIRRSGNLHKPTGSDYFVFPKDLMFDMPPFALGRAGWDNWMIYVGRKIRVPVIDATEGVTIIHQNHDYRHLQDGQPHYRLPESHENVRMAGGRQMIFTLLDSTWEADSSGVRRKGVLEPSLPRRIETSLISLFGPGKLSKMVTWFFKPDSMLRYIGRGMGKTSKSGGSNREIASQPETDK